MNDHQALKRINRPSRTRTDAQTRNVTIGLFVFTVGAAGLFLGFGGWFLVVMGYGAWRMGR